MSRPDDVAELGRYAKQQLGEVHLWLNNAGSVTRKRLLADVDPSDISAAVGERTGAIAASYGSAWRSSMVVLLGQWALACQAPLRVTCCVIAIEGLRVPGSCQVL